VAGALRLPPYRVVGGISTKGKWWCRLPATRRHALICSEDPEQISIFAEAIGTLVERTTRFNMMLHLPPMEGHGTGEQPKIALAAHGTEAVCDTIVASIAALQEQLRRSLTWDHI
jgi:hypothetical protein